MASQAKSRYTEPQRRSIEHLDGPLLMCAGAGSGKTFTLQNRIAYALETGKAGEIDEILPSPSPTRQPPRSSTA